jgi:hypothetical protein
MTVKEIQDTLDKILKNGNLGRLPFIDYGYNFYEAGLAQKITETGRRNMKEMLNSAVLLPNLPYFLIEKKGKQIFNEIDPYGEENWD